MGFEGSFDGIYEMNGSLRAYQSQAVAGGRVMLNPKYAGTHCRGKFAYLDAIGLYPSAIVFQCEELGGFPTGPAQLLAPSQLSYDFLRRETSEYTVDVKITAIGKRQDSIPFVLFRREDKTMDYVNELPEGNAFVATVDKVTLEDWIEFHQIEFEIVRGIYWTGPLNNVFGLVQRKLHAERDICKKSGAKARAQIYKLIQN
jgi:hypothetical protein